MDIFGDKTYQNLDWITKATEPIVYSLNEKMASLPPKFIFTIEDFMSICKDDYSIRYLDIYSSTNHFFRKNNIQLTEEEESELKGIYSLKIKGNTSVDSCGKTIEINPIIDFSKKTIEGGEISLVKTKECFDEEDLKKRMGKWGVGLLGKCQLDNNKEVEVRLNELLDLFGSAEGLKKRSVSGKFSTLRSEYRKVMKENKWNIRNVDLSNDVAKWLRSYIETGNLAAMVNFCKLKAATHRGYPIYHIEEEL